ncbi:MAG: hypothetical protein JSS02_25305 [Planctomycetes bacterium]|nr:hypothetical protein [Planctomycetota bacterium]
MKRNQQADIDYLYIPSSDYSHPTGIEPVCSARRVSVLSRRYIIATLLIAIAAVTISTLMLEIRHRREKRLAELLQRHGGIVFVTNRLPRSLDSWLGPSCPKWLFHAECVSANDRSFSDDDMAIVSQMTTVRQLDLERTSVTDSGLLGIAGLPLLEDLIFSETPIDGSGLRAIPKTSHIALIILSETRVNDAGVAHILACNKLRALYLNDTLVTDDCLRYICRMSNLEELSLAGTAVKGTGFRDCKDLKHLRYLSLDRTKITDVELQYLVGLAGLTGLSLEDTAVTDEAIDLFRTERPDVDVGR